MESTKLQNKITDNDKAANNGKVFTEKNKSGNEKRKRKLSGIVVSDKMNKTIVVKVDRSRKHPRYKKYYTTSKRFKAHDEENKYKIGDKIIIEESRPLSKDKKWIVVGKV